MEDAARRFTDAAGATGDESGAAIETKRGSHRGKRSV